MTISIIVATDNLGAIGKDNKIPWHLPEDLKWFKTKTLHKAVLMGRKTYESIYSYLGKPLPDRQSVVFSTNAKELLHDEKYKYAEVALKDDLESRLQVYKDAEVELIVAGGESIYKQALPYADLIYYTLVNTTVEKPDSFFPVLNNNEWQLYYHETNYFPPVGGEPRKLSHTFMIYKRVPKQ